MNINRSSFRCEQPTQHPTQGLYRAVPTTYLQISPVVGTHGPALSSELVAEDALLASRLGIIAVRDLDRTVATEE